MDDRPQGPRPPRAPDLRGGRRCALRWSRCTATRRARPSSIALAYAKAIGGTRAGVLDTTFEEETETDLFGEQVVLCGGLTSSSSRPATRPSSSAGYQPESAYFETLHEVKLIVDLIYEGGIANMRYSISDTAEYGDLTRGPRIITDRTRAEMRTDPRRDPEREVRRGVDPREPGGSAHLQRLAKRAADHPIEEVGDQLRSMMPWIGPGGPSPRTSPGVEARRHVSAGSHRRGAGSARGRAR